MNSVFRLDSKMVDSSNLQPGLHRQAKRVDFDMRLTSPVRKKSGARFVSVEERLANGSIRFHESLLDDVSSGANAKDLINLCIQRRIQAEMKLSGFLMAEQEGITRFTSGHIMTVSFPCMERNIFLYDTRRLQSCLMFLSCQ